MLSLRCAGLIVIPFYIPTMRTRHGGFFDLFGSFLLRPKALMSLMISVLFAMRLNQVCSA